MEWKLWDILEHFLYICTSRITDMLKPMHCGYSCIRIWVIATSNDEYHHRSEYRNAYEEKAITKPSIGYHFRSSQTHNRPGNPFVPVRHLSLTSCSISDSYSSTINKNTCLNTLCGKIIMHILHINSSLYAIFFKTGCQLHTISVHA